MLVVVPLVVFASVDRAERSFAHLVGYIVVNSLYRPEGGCVSIESQWTEVCRSGTRGVGAVVVDVAVVCGDAMIRKREQRQKPQNNREPRIGWFRFSRS